MVNQPKRVALLASVDVMGRLARFLQDESCTNISVINICKSKKSNHEWHALGCMGGAAFAHVLITMIAAP